MLNTYHGIRHVSPLESYNRSGKRYHLFQCHCGIFFEAQLENVKNTNTKSCGCRQKTANIKHGFAANGIIQRELHSYYSAKKRCTNPKNKDWHSYGGRGIEFRFTSFKQFIDDIGLRPEPKLSLDRIDSDGHYEVGNVRWADAYTQQHNKKPRTGA